MNNLFRFPFAPWGTWGGGGGIRGEFCSARDDRRGRWNSGSDECTIMTTTGTNENANRHALSAVEQQRAQLEKLLKDPSKPAYIPPPPKDKTIRPAREMMKNVQGSSAGAGSGEFHVYKASRRREYERLKLLEESAQKVGRGSIYRQPKNTEENDRKRKMPSLRNVGKRFWRRQRNGQRRSVRKDRKRRR
jgi:Protein of unknown function (DUF1168)